MTFDDAQLRVADRNQLRPIVGNGDRAFFAGRPSDDLATGRGVIIVMQVVETFRPATGRAAATFAEQSHRSKLPHERLESKEIGIVAERAAAWSRRHDVVHGGAGRRWRSQA